MTVTKDQAQMLATLATACRPLGARRWDTAGTMAALEKVKDRSLPEVVMATIRAAADRDVDTPGVIPTAGSHWQETRAVAPTPPPERPGPDGYCTACGHSKVGHDIRFRGDHEFTTTADIARQRALDTHRAVEEIKAQVAAKRGEPVPEPEGLKTMVENSPAVAEMKRAMAEARERLAQPRAAESTPDATTDGPDK